MAKEIIVVSSDSSTDEDTIQGPLITSVPKEGPSITSVPKKRPSIARVPKQEPLQELLEWYGYDTVEEYLEDTFLIAHTRIPQTRIALMRIPLMNLTLQSIKVKNKQEKDKIGTKPDKKREAWRSPEKSRAVSVTRARKTKQDVKRRAENAKFTKAY
nr:hypothetical protein [Tanacetum cinerariifolium]